MNLINKLKLNRLSASFWGYVLIVLMIVTPWFLRSGYLFFTDNVWGPVIKLDWTGSWFFLKLLLNGLSFVFPVDFLEKIFISGVLVLILLGGRILVKAILEYYNDRDSNGGQTKISSGLIFVLSLFVLFNPFVYDRALYGQSGILIAYGFFLFALAYLFKTWRTLDFKNMSRAAIFNALVLMFSVHFIFLLLPFYLLFSVGLFLKYEQIKASRRTKEFWRALSLSFIIVLIINANWLIALAVKASPLAGFVEQGIMSQDLIAFQTAGKDTVDTLTNVLLMSGFWGKEQLRYLDLTDFPGWQRSFILLIPIIFYGICLSFWKRARKEKIFSSVLLIIFAIAVFLALGIKSPLTCGLTMFLYDHLPLYKGLREPQKWVAVIIPIYLFYLTIGTAASAKIKAIMNNRLASGLILAAIIIMQAPYLFWGFNRQVQSTPYPNDWYKVNDLLVDRSVHNGSCHDKILFLPWHMYMSFNWTKKIIASPARTFFICPVLSGTNMEWGGIYDNSRSLDSAAIVNWLKTRGKNGPPILTEMPIRYIILAKELDFTSYLWLNKLSYVKPFLETATLLVYEIKP